MPGNANKVFRQEELVVIHNLDFQRCGRDDLSAHDAHRVRYHALKHFFNTGRLFDFHKAPPFLPWGSRIAFLRPGLILLLPGYKNAIWETLGLFWLVLRPAYQVGVDPAVYVAVSVHARVGAADKVVRVFRAFRYERAFCGARLS